MDNFGIFTEPETIRFERLLPGPIEQVWAYLTESEKRARWLAAGTMELYAGGSVELIFNHDNLTPHDDPIPEKYKNHNDSVLLVLTHRRLGDNREILKGIAAGWHTHLGILVDKLNNKEPKPFWKVHTTMEKEYEDKLPQKSQ